MKTLLSVHLLLVGSLWYFINGVLHTIMVIFKHQGGYDRELLRLLLDGYALITAGLFLFVSYLMVLNKVPYGSLVGIISAISMLVYCALIFPFLKSFGTIIISILMVIVCIRWGYSSIP